MKSKRKQVSPELEKRLRPDEKVQVATEMDKRTLIPNGIGSSILTLVFAIPFIGVFGVMGASAIIEVLSSGPVGSGGSTTAYIVAYGIVGAIALLVGFYPLIVSALAAKFGTVEYAITDERFIKVEDMVVSTSDESVPINRVRDADYSEGMIDKFLGNGDIELQGTQGDSLTFNNAPESDTLYEKCQVAIQETEAVDDYSNRK